MCYSEYMSKYKYSDEDLLYAVKSSRSFNEVQKNLSAGKSGSVYMHIKKRIVSLGIDTSHFTPYWNSKNVGGHNKIDYKDILVLRKDKMREKSARLRRAMLEHGFTYKCYSCGITEWEGKSISLECEHKNGLSYDNRPINLCFLCPNCHSQTTTYGYKGKLV